MASALGVESEDDDGAERGLPPCAEPQRELV